MKQSESSREREVYNLTSLPQEEESEINNLTFTKRTRKTTRKAPSKYKKGNNED